MENSLPFGEILEAADKLPIVDQESLRDISTDMETLKKSLTS